MTMRVSRAMGASGARRTNRAGAGCLIALVAAGCASTPPEQDPVQIKLNDLDTRLARIERVVANQSLLDLANQIEALRSDVRSMHNDVDLLNHNLDAVRKQQHDLYVDLDQRLKAVETRSVGASPGSGSPAAGSAGGAAGGAGAGVAPDGAADGGDKAAYQSAFDLLKSSQYDKAVSAFQAFLASYPTSTLADNAQYWLGEAYYVNKAFADALAAFHKVVDNFPGSRKLSDALLKIGYCNYELKDFAAARFALERVTTQFPDSTAAPLARQRLDRMVAEGH